MTAATADFADEAQRSPPREWPAQWTVLLTANLLGHAPLALLHLRSLWQQEQYQYFPFVIGAIVWLLWSRWREAPPVETTDVRWPSLPWWIIGASLVLLSAAIVTVSPWLAFVSLNVSLAAVFVLIGRRRRVEYLWGIWALLWLLTPAPLGVDGRLVRMLQRLSSQLSSAVLDGVGILHLMSGNVLVLPDKRFFVDEACSGIVSVMSIIACAMIYAIWRNRSVRHLVALIVAGVFWAVVLNVGRIATIAIAYRYFDVDLSTGAAHEGLGLTLFLLMFGMLVSTDYLLQELLAPIDEAELAAGAERNLLVRLWNRSTPSAAASRPPTSRSGVAADGAAPWSMTRIAAWSTPLLLLGVVQLVWTPSPDSAEAEAAIERALALDASLLPAKIGPWRRVGFEAVDREAYSDFGKYSRQYTYEHQDDPRVTAMVSLDFPYLGGWHDLCVCYRNSGWTIDQREVQPEGAGPSGWPLVVGELSNESAGQATVCFAGFDAGGELAEPPSEAVLFRPWFRLRRRLLRNVAAQLFQVQVFAAGDASKDRQIERDLEQLLLDARSRFRSAVAQADDA